MTGILDPAEAVHLFEHLKAVHLWHVDIQQHQIDRQILFQQSDRLPPVGSLNVMILISQNVHQHHSIEL